MDEDLLEGPDEQLKAPVSSGCHESDPRDGHFTDDSDSDHDRFLKSVQHMISGGTHGEHPKTDNKKLKTTSAPPPSRPSGSKSRAGRQATTPTTITPVSSPANRSRVNPGNTTSHPSSTPLYTPRQPSNPFDCETAYPKSANPTTFPVTHTPPICYRAIDCPFSGYANQYWQREGYSDKTESEKRQQVENYCQTTSHPFPS